MKEKYAWKLGDLIIPLMAASLGLYYLKTIQGLPFLAQMYGGGLCVVVLLFAVRIFILAIKGGVFKKSAKPSGTGSKTKIYLRAAVVVGFIIIYLLLFPYAGYTVSSILFISGTLYFLGARSIAAIIRNAVVVTMIGFCLFALFLNVPFPLDPFSQALKTLVYSMIQ